MISHPEGGYYRETYRSMECIDRVNLPPRFGGDRAYSTGALYLLTRGSRSRLHRIQSDEMWHFYLGGPLLIAEISPEGSVRETVLGNDILQGHEVQWLVPAGCWFGAYPLEEAEYCFVGCTVAPGFDFADFEMGDRETLLRQYPGAQRVIEKLL